MKLDRFEEAIACCDEGLAVSLIIEGEVVFSVTKLRIPQSGAMVCSAILLLKIAQNGENFQIQPIISFVLVIFSVLTF